MALLSRIYRVENRDKRGSAANGFTRPTISEFFSTQYDYEIPEVSEDTVTDRAGTYVIDSFGEPVTI